MKIPNPEEQRNSERRVEVKKQAPPKIVTGSDRC